jgi:hypothetical protein
MIHSRLHKIIHRVVNSHGHTLTLPAANPDVNNGDGTFTMATVTVKIGFVFLSVSRLKIGVSN